MTAQKLYEGTDISKCTAAELISGKKLYNYITESAEIAEKEGTSIDDVLDEGIFSAIVGGLSGATIGPAIGKAICKVLSIDEKGILGNLICSKLVLSALGAQLGYRM